MIRTLKVFNCHNNFDWYSKRPYLDRETLDMTNLRQTIIRHTITSGKTKLMFLRYVQAPGFVLSSVCKFTVYGV